MANDDEVEQVWTEFWTPLLYANGVLDLEQVKRELYDFRMAMKEVSLVYDHITGGKFSKVTTPAQHVISATSEHYKKMWEWINAELSIDDPAIDSA